MEYDILTKFADLIGSQMKEFMTTNEEIKELQYALDESCNIANKLKLLADNFKTKVDRRYMFPTPTVYQDILAWLFGKRYFIISARGANKTRIR